MIGMAAVVTADVPAERLWYGAPARDHGPRADPGRRPSLSAGRSGRAASDVGLAWTRRPTSDAPDGQPCTRARSRSASSTRIATRLGTLGIGIALARVVGPEQFGTYAVALLALTAALSFNELGVSLAIVRWPGDPEKIAPTVSTISIASEHADRRGGLPAGARVLERDGRARRGQRRARAGDQRPDQRDRARRPRRCCSASSCRSGGWSSTRSTPGAGRSRRCSWRSPAWAR